MPQANMVQEGHAIDHTPGSALTAGDVVVQNDLVGVPANDVAASALGALGLDQVYDFTKSGSSGPVFSVGDPVYWDDSNNLAVATPNGNTYLGVCVKAAATGDSLVRVKLCPQSKFSRALLYAIVAASAAVTNTTTETTFDNGTVSVPAGTLKPGDVIRVRLQGIATATNSTDTLTVKLYVGSIEIATTGAVDVANNDIFYMDFEIVIRTNGASGTLVAAGLVGLGAAGTVTGKAQFKASTAVDTTAALAVAAKATWSVANAGNSCRLDVFNVSVVRK